MGSYILNPETKRPNFWPWPQESWLFNKHALERITIVTYMDDLLKKSDELWTKQDNAFYTAIHEEPK